MKKERLEKLEKFQEQLKEAHNMEGRVVRLLIIDLLQCLLEWIAEDFKEPEKT